MASRKRKAQPTQATTINNFFHTQTVNVSAPAPAEEPPGRWLPPPPPRDSRVSQTLGGALRIQCHQCRASKNATYAHGPEQFVPAEYHPRDAAAYGAALETLGEARASKNGNAFLTARETIATLATAKCAKCRTILTKCKANPDTTVGVCRAEWQRLKALVFHTCSECGTQRAVEANHGQTYAANAKAHKAMVATHGQQAADAAYPAAERKLANVSQTDDYWACHGGVEAMRAEAGKCASLCSMCHALDPSSNAAPENATSRSKAAAKEHATKKIHNEQVHKAGYREDKRAYVNAIKRVVYTCENLNCPCDGPSGGRCTDGFEGCYDWDHIVAATKGRAIVKIVNDGRSFATAKPEILAELGLPPDFDVETDDIPPVAERRCRLLCRNCHVTRSEWDVSSL